MSNESVLIDHFLQHVGPFQALAPEHLQQLTERVTQVSVAAGETIIRQGELGDRCYFIQDGEVEVLQDDIPRARQVACLGSGAIFGEAALLTEAPRNATVRATKPCQLLSLRKKELLEVLSWDRRVAPVFFELLSLRDAPIRRTDIVEEEYTAQDGEKITVLKDAKRGTYFRLSSVGRHIWEHLDGHHNLKDLSLGYMAVSNSFIPYAIAETVGGLVASGFALSHTSKAKHYLPLPLPVQKLFTKLRRGFQWRRMFSAVDPWVARFYRTLGIRHLYSPLALFWVAAFSVVGIVLFTHDLPHVMTLLTTSPPAFLIWTGILSLPIIVLCHDAGHAFTTHFFGRTVLGIGIGWNWFSPVLYVDTSDMWPLPPPKRIAVHMAGMVVNLWLAGMASLVGLASHHDILLLFSLLSYLIVIINLIPVFNSDGQYALADLCELWRSFKKRSKTPHPHEKKLIQYYKDHTERFYIEQWDPDDIHFGLFEDNDSIHFYNLIPEHEKIKKAGIIRMTEATVKPANIQKTDLVVDAGCGVGGTSIYLAQNYGCRVIGINISEHQLKIAKQKVDATQLSSLIQLQYGNCSEHLPLPDHSVDVIVNIESACQYSNRQKFMAECARILKPGGRMAVQDWVATDNISAEDYQKSIGPMCEPWRIASMETPSSYRQLLEKNGLRVVEMVDLNRGVKPNMDFMRNAAQAVKQSKPVLSPDEALWYRHLKSITDAYFNGHFAVIRYLAIKH